MAEHTFSDFSAGMNALASVDKLDPRECLLAENCRLDETGNIQSAGAATIQNTATYSAAGGTNPRNVHSLYWNPSIGGVAGVGQDVFIGPTLGGLASGLAGKNSTLQKMSFTSSPNRVYFDVGSVGYWTDMTNLLTVDWAPPAASTAIITSSTATSFTGTSTVTATNFGFALSTTSNMQGLQVTLVSTETIGAIGTITSGTGTATYVASLLVGGVAVGTSMTYYEELAGQSGTSTYTNTFTFGGPTMLWGYGALTPAQVNASSFGFLFAVTYTETGMKYSVAVNGPATCSAYQSTAGLFAGTGGAGQLTGTYTYKATFVAANGEESDGSNDSAAVTLSAKTGTLTSIPTGDARTVSRNIYRKGGALTSYYYVGSIPDNTTTTYNDNETDITALTAGIILSGDVPGDYPNSRLGSTPVRFPVYHYDRVFWVNQNKPNQIIWSKPLDGFAYPAVNFINVGDSKPISRIISIFGELIILKTDSIWRLTGTDESSFDLSQTPSAVGTDEPFTVVALPDKVLFSNRFGLWVFNGYTSQPMTPKLDLWFKQEDRTGVSLFGVNGFHPPEVTVTSVTSNFEAVGNSEKFYWSYAESGQASNNSILVFDVKHSNITKRYGITPLSLAIDPVNGFVYVGDGNGYVYLLDDWNGTTQGTSNVNFDFQHGYQDVQRGSNKSLWAIEFFLNTNGQSVTPTVYYDNGAASEPLASISTTGLQRVLRTIESSNSRKMQNFSVRFNASLSAVNSSGTPQIQIVHVKPFFDVRVGRARTGQ